VGVDVGVAVDACPSRFINAGFCVGGTAPGASSASGSLFVSLLQAMHVTSNIAKPIFLYKVNFIF
jgi:F0F1-type ATP synthase membrane subunit c/vacuolar-type H+-ATPase subunit K